MDARADHTFNKKEWVRKIFLTPYSQSGHHAPAVLRMPCQISSSIVGRDKLSYTLSRIPMSLVKSAQRVADHGEVFTPAWMVEAMLDLEHSRR